MKHDLRLKPIWGEVNNTGSIHHLDLKFTYIHNKVWLNTPKKEHNKHSVSFVICIVIFLQIDAKDRQHLGVCISSPFEKECDHLITMTT
jgi:hypothetical protein